jgi:integrase
MTGSVLVRVGKGGKRRTVGMDDWAWDHVARWTERRIELPIGPLFCTLAGPNRGRGWSATAARGELRRLAAQAGVRRRFAPHQLRHAHAIEMAHEGIPLTIIQRQRGHAHLGITSIYQRRPALVAEPDSGPAVAHHGPVAAGAVLTNANQSPHGARVAQPTLFELSSLRAERVVAA